LAALVGLGLLVVRAVKRNKAKKAETSEPEESVNPVDTK